jgi:hypothetical protein
MKYKIPTNCRRSPPPFFPPVFIWNFQSGHAGLCQVSGNAISVPCPLLTNPAILHILPWVTHFCWFLPLVHFHFHFLSDPESDLAVQGWELSPGWLLVTQMLLSSEVTWVTDPQLSLLWERGSEYGLSYWVCSVLKGPDTSLLCTTSTQLCLSLSYASGFWFLWKEAGITMSASASTCFWPLTYCIV